MRKYPLLMILVLLFVGKESRGQDEKVQIATGSDMVDSTLQQQITLRKILLEQANKDGITVTDKEVEKQLDNRICYFIQLYGSEEKLEQASGKTIYALKEDNRQQLKDQLLAEKMENRILKHVKVSHAEVIDFFDSISRDSLRVYPESVALGQIVIDVATSLDVAPNDTVTALEKLGRIRQGLITGEYTFSRAVKKCGASSSGMLTDPMTGSALIDVSELDRSLSLLLDSMQVGNYSQSQIFNNTAGGRSCRILYLGAKIPAHKANLGDDYDKIQDAALQQKKIRKMQDWIAGKSVATRL